MLVYRLPVCRYEAVLIGDSYNGALLPEGMWWNERFDLICMLMLAGF